MKTGRKQRKGRKKERKGKKKERKKKGKNDSIDEVRNWELGIIGKNKILIHLKRVKNTS